MVVLAEAKRADFTYLKRVLDLTDGNLGRHLQVLEEAGLRRARQGVRTGQAAHMGDADEGRQGRAALGRELDTMERLIRRVRER